MLPPASLSRSLHSNLCPALPSWSAPAGAGRCSVSHHATEIRGGEGGGSRWSVSALLPALSSARELCQPQQLTRGKYGLITLFMGSKIHNIIHPWKEHFPPPGTARHCTALQNDIQKSSSSLNASSVKLICVLHRGMAHGGAHAPVIELQVLGGAGDGRQRRWWDV